MGWKVDMLDYEAIHPDLRISLNSQLMAGAAHNSGANVTWYDAFFFVASYGGLSLPFWSCSGCSDDVALKIADRKHLTKAILKENGFEVIDGYFITNEKELLQAYRDIGGAVVLKPSFGSMKGVGVHIDVKGERNLLDIYNNGDKKYLIVERFLKGDEYRVLVLDGNVIAVTQRDAANVVGDGVSTIGELIDAKNKSRLPNPHLGTRPIEKNRLLEEFLAAQDLSMDSVPDLGCKVYCTHVANFARGGDSYNVTNVFPSEVKKYVAAAVQAVPGLNLAGVDLLLSDGVPYVLEFEANPAIGCHHFPMKGEPIDVASMIWEYACQKKRK